MSQIQWFTVDGMMVTRTPSGWLLRTPEGPAHVPDPKRLWTPVRLAWAAQVEKLDAENAEPNTQDRMVRKWFDGCCELRRGSYLRNDEIARSLQAWCDKNGYPPISRAMTSRVLGALGDIRRDRVDGHRALRGLHWREGYEPPESSTVLDSTG